MRALCFGVVFASLAFGQLESNTVTVTASRSVYVQADQAVFALSIASDAEPALAGAGITGAQLISSAPGFTWSYSLAVPLAEVPGTIAKLTAAARTLKLTFNLQGTQASPQLLAAQQCATSDLIADARAQAQKLTAAAGAGLGPILALSQPSAATPIGVGVPGVTLAIRTGDFSSGATGSYASFLLGTVTQQPQTPLTCSLIVKFGLLRY